MVANNKDFFTLGLARVAPEKPECLTACQSHYSDAFKGRHMNIENWKPVVGWEGHYEVSDCGSVRSLTKSVLNRWGRRHIRQGKILSNRVVNHGYLQVALWNLKRKDKYVHRLVCEAFLTAPLGCEEVNHRNGIKADNRLSNLEWTNRLGNMRHAYATGLIQPRAKGESQP